MTDKTSSPSSDPSLPPTSGSDAHSDASTGSSGAARETSAAPGTAGATANASTAWQSPHSPRAGSTWRIAFVLALVVAVVLAGGLWYQHQQFQQARTQLSAQLTQGNATARQAQDQARQALEELQRQSERLRTLQGVQEQTDIQVQGLEEALQVVTDSGSDLMLLNDIDRLVVMAQQQLQLSGNVGNAIVALENAQSQLARANRTGFSSLQQSLNGDIDRLRAVASVDVTALAARLDTLATLVSQAPLQVPEGQLASALPSPETGTPAPADAAAAPANQSADEQSWWRRALDDAQSWSAHAWQSVSQDLHRLIEVRRIDDATALLMSPDQAERFRDNLRLRVMTARLALLMRQPDVWVSELTVLQNALDTRFDTRQASVQRAQALVRSLLDTPIAIALPSLDNSLRAIQAQREVLARADHGNGGQSVGNQNADQPDTPANVQSDGEQASSDDAAALPGASDESATPSEQDAAPGQPEPAAPAAQQGSDAVSGQTVPAGTSSRAGHNATRLAAAHVQPAHGVSLLGMRS